MARLRGWSSGNTVGAQAYTDGYVHFPLLPPIQFATRCRRCTRYYLTDSAKEIGIDDGSGKYAEVGYAEELDELGFLEAVADIKRLNRDQKKMLRLKALWLANDPIRHQLKGLEGANLELSDAQRSNLDQLIGMLQEGSDHDQFLRAALLRIAGRFDDALAVLGYIKFDDQFSRYTVEFITDLCREKDALLYRVDEPLILRSRPRYVNLKPFSTMRRLEAARYLSAALAGIGHGMSILVVWWLVARFESDWSSRVHFWVVLAALTAIRGGIQSWNSTDS